MSKKAKPGFFSKVLVFIVDRLRKTGQTAARSTVQRREPESGKAISRLQQDEVGLYYSNPLVASMQGLDGKTEKGSIDDYWSSYNNPSPDPYTGAENSDQARPI